MFDNRDLETYRNIKVPSELKTKILADCEAETERGQRKIGGAFPSRRLVRSLSAIAACFVLAVAIVSMTRMNTSFVTLSYEGTTVSGERTAIHEIASLAEVGSRTVTPTGIPLAFDVRGEAEVAVSGGSLYGVSEDGEEVLSLGERTEITEDTVIWWAVISGSGTYELTVTADGKETVYILEMNELTPSGVIYKK